MAQVNACLKRLFVGFNVFFAIVGGVIIALTPLFRTSVTTSQNANVWAGLIIIGALGTVTMVIAIVGACGAHKESKGAMIVFLVFMVIGSLVLLRFTLLITSQRINLEGNVKEYLQGFLPLDEASEEVQTEFNSLQEMSHCCGVFSYTDWRADIPKSCVCRPEDEIEGLCQRVGHKVMESHSGSEIYSQPCFPIILNEVVTIVNVLLGVVASLAALAVMGMALSSAIIHQMRSAPSRPVVMLQVPTTLFAPQLPKYQELYNSPAH
ncbi:tetraspanin-8-like [Myripristis murdjan]|uniref:Tetraspanin n=1 Tax=Myripristis murdjan TaxID=586833 RepID=A0A667XRQ5_9TELE|nr:tetraspanin-8-like [Myripristis murdjan]